MSRDGLLFSAVSEPTFSENDSASKEVSHVNRQRFSVLRKERFQVSRCKLQEERRPFSQALLSKLVTDIQQKSIAEILKQVQNDAM